MFGGCIFVIFLIDLLIESLFQLRVNVKVKHTTYYVAIYNCLDTLEKLTETLEFKNSIDVDFASINNFALHVYSIDGMSQ